MSQQWADELLDIEARARELVVRRYTCVETAASCIMPPLTADSPDSLCFGQRQLRCCMNVARRCCRNVKAEALEFEQVLDLFEVRPKEDAAYSADWEANRQRALALVMHIVESATQCKPPPCAAFLLLRFPTAVDALALPNRRGTGVTRHSTS